MIKAIVFDLDGVLVDSEPVYMENEYQKLLKYIPDLKKEALMPMVGMSMKMYVEFMSNLLKMDPDSQEFKEYRAYSNQGFEVDYNKILRPHVRETLTKLKQMNYRIALASSGDLKDIMMTLNQTGLTEFFEVICSGDMFHQSKPNPEIYLTTFAKLGLKSEECMVVEDSDLGLKAGIASGARVCCMRETRFSFTQDGANYYIDDLSEIIRILSEQVKAIFFDIDGTLTDMATHQMPKSTEYALEQLKKKGIKIFLCTGRARIELTEANMLDESIFDGAIFMNGQYCLVDGKIVLDFPLSIQQKLAIRDFVKKKKISCAFFTDDATFTNLVDDRLIAAQKTIGTPIPPIRSIDDLQDLRVYQACPSLIEGEEKELLESIDGVKTTRWADCAIDVVAKNAGKDVGIKGILDYCGIDPRATMSFGDGHNDVSMYNVTMINVAMGNAVEALKEKASYITDSLDKDGLYNALKYFDIIN